MKNNKILLLLFTLTVLILNIIISGANATNQTIPNTHDHTTGQSYNINYFDKDVGGNVLNNSKISKNILNSPLSKKIVSMSKKGSVILKFGNEKGPKILLCAGIHGNEVAANLATLKFLEKIKNKKIKGTIYVIPFIIPKDTASNSRSWYYSMKRCRVDPNRVANAPGTPGYKIVQFARKNNIKFVIDIHSGSGLVRHKKGLVFASKRIVSAAETNWIKYIKKTLNPKISYTIPYKGSIQDCSQSNNINTITFEVEKDKCSVSHWAKIEYNMIITACKYLKLF